MIERDSEILAWTRFNASLSDHYHVNNIFCHCHATCIAFCIVEPITRPCHTLRLDVISLLPIRWLCDHFIHRLYLSPSGLGTLQCVRQVVVTAYEYYAYHGWTHHSTLLHPATIYHPPISSNARRRRRRPCGRCRRGWRSLGGRRTRGSCARAVYVCVHVCVLA
jgi:hypothetical protein